MVKPRIRREEVLPGIWQWAVRFERLNRKDLQRLNAAWVFCHRLNHLEHYPDADYL